LQAMSVIHLASYRCQRLRVVCYAIWNIWHLLRQAFSGRRLRGVTCVRALAIPSDARSAQPTGPDYSAFNNILYALTDT
ncbi:hypothetical protein, partial [Klebsiella pneumoniae]|uniref:hypothetical protein n=1 Tax=Klebsiella pneumoniae TaxID=573 RepID=UPI001C7073D7